MLSATEQSVEFSASSLQGSFFCRSRRGRASFVKTGARKVLLNFRAPITSYPCVPTHFAVWVKFGITDVNITQYLHLSFVKIGKRKAAFLLSAYIKLHSLVACDAVWHFENKKIASVKCVYCVTHCVIGSLASVRKSTEAKAHRRTAPRFVLTITTSTPASEVCSSRIYLFG